jgi:hypothetical protein
VPTEQRQLASVDGRFFPIETVHAAINTVAFEQIEALVMRAKTPRALARGLKAMKTEGSRDRIVGEALRRVLASNDEVPMVEAIRSGGAPVATFKSSAFGGASDQAT